MRIASYIIAGRRSYGVVVDDKIIDLGSRLPHATLREALAAGSLDEMHAAAMHVVPDYSVSAVRLLTPLPDAEKIICIGRNYRGHVTEGNLKLPSFPSVFLRMHRSVVADGEPILRPRVSDSFDFEGELALVIGTPGRHIRPEDALSHVAGYTCFMDGSVRDYQFEHSLTVGKNFAASGSFGPWLVTADEIPDPTRLNLSTRLNGQIVQRTQTDDLIFSIPEIISYLSTFTELIPGDVIATGTPEGVGFTRKPPLWLKPGDVVEVDVSGIGALRNPVIAEGPTISR